MTTLNKKHQAFWDALEVVISVILIISALHVHTLLSTLLLLLLAVTLCIVPFYHRKYPDRELPQTLGMFQWLVRLVLIGFLLWCAFWLFVVILFSRSGWQF